MPRVRGLTSRGATIATPTKMRRTPIPSATSRSPPEKPIPSVPPRIPSSPIAVTTTAASGAKRANRSWGRTEPSRTAAIGGTRVER